MDFTSDTRSFARRQRLHRTALVMIDTVRLTQAITMHTPQALLNLGFSPRCGHIARAKQPATWILSSLPKSYPRLTWTAASDGHDYLSAEASLPKLMLGSNV